MWCAAMLLLFPIMRVECCDAVSECNTASMALLQVWLNCTHALPLTRAACWQRNLPWLFSFCASSALTLF